MLNRCSRNSRRRTANCCGVFVAIAALHLGADIARADLDCVAASRGGTLTWDNSWQSDQLDEGVPYRVATLTEHRERTSRTITVELVALLPARRSVRYLSVSDQQVARAVCSHLSTPNHESRQADIVIRENRLTRISNLPTVIRSGASTAPADPTGPNNPETPFIRFGPKGWILSDPPPYEAMTLCEVAGKSFRCLQHDKSAHGRELSDIEQELSILP